MKMPPAPVTVAITVAAAATWLLLSTTGYDVNADVIGGFIPARLSGIEVLGALPVWVTPLSATLLHGGFVHLAFNMLMFVYCGQAVERVIGSPAMALTFVAGAYAAAGAQYALNPYDMSPMIGASGAISAIFGAYALLFGRPKGFAKNPGLAFALNIVWLAAAWIAIQLLVGFATAGSGYAIAIGAHIGGFAMGLILARPLLLFRYRKA